MLGNSPNMDFHFPTWQGGLVRPIPGAAATLVDEIRAEQEQAAAGGQAAGPSPTETTAAGTTGSLRLTDLADKM